MFNKMVIPTGGGQENPTFLEATLSNSNKTWSAEWNFDAECVIAFGALSGTANVMLIDLSNGHIYAANTTSLVWADYGNFGGSITYTKRSVSITHNYGWTSAISYIPMTNKPTVYI